MLINSLSVHRRDKDWPLLSISILAYNHEGRIETAINSALEQRTQFNIEIIIGDDFSQDRTAEIIRSYESKYPELIRAIYHPKKYQEIPGRINNITNLYACRGKYIAMLDGDDYWTDKDKLQKQVDFLEKNPDFNICFHDVRIHSENSGVPDQLYSNFQPTLRTLVEEKEGTEYDFSDIFQFGGSCMPTSSMVFRAEKIKPLPDWFFEVAAADYSIQLLAAEGGKVKYFPQVWGVYTRHENNISATYFRSVTNLENKLKELDIYKQHFRKYYKPHYFKRLKCNTLFRLGKAQLRSGRIWAGMENLLWSVRVDPQLSWKRFKEKLSLQ